MECSLQSAANLILQAETIVITAHVHPDGDSLGSMLALYQYLEAKGKNVQMLLDDTLPVLYEFLPGIQKIHRSAEPPIDADLLVILDASDEERIGKIGKLVKAAVLNIDHHISNTKFADYWYIDSAAAATGEVILAMLKLMDAQISPDMAVCLYTAIATDCGFFRYANTSAQTLRYAADLVECGVKPHLISEYVDVRPLSSLLILQKALGTLELYCNGKIAAITISQSLLDDDDSTEGLVNYPRNIVGVEIAILFKFVEAGVCRISFRSKNADVSRLALEFGGGGHIRAAGCTVKGTVEETKRKVIAAAKRQLQELPA
ncbi:MAG: bifunctional oligoribonuclease/PAP phosphatase NrnA [Veillonellales bacterium]